MTDLVMRPAPVQDAGADFSRVVEAAGDYARRTGDAPLWLSGWEVEDSAIAPPAGLARRLAAIHHQPRHYTYSRDFHTARERATDLFSQGMRLAGERFTPAHVAILPNSSQGLLLALTALREQGIARIVIAAPVYYSSVTVCRHLNLAVTLVPAADYLTGALDVVRLARELRDPHAALLLTNPAYSLGVEYGAGQLHDLFAALPEHAPILLDETRLGLHWTSDLPWYPADYPPRTLILRSPSKIFFLNGTKTSFLLGSPQTICQVEGLSEALLGSVAGNGEAVALAYLDAWSRWLGEMHARRVGPLRAWKRGVVAALRRNHVAVQDVVTAAGVALAPVNSGPYVLAAFSAPHVLDSERMAREHGMVTMSSDYFYHVDAAWQGVRLNLCGSPEQLRAGLARLLAAMP
jgi:aspartate/methionine/tyrosine aminotransferase